MSWLHGLRHRVRTLLLPSLHARELDEEMRLHLELDAMQLQDLGRASRHFGSRTYYAEETRLMTWLGKLDVVRQDLGYAWRTIRRAPGFTALVVLTLALGIGVNAATFAVLDELYLRPPGGVADPGSVRRIWMEYGNTEFTLDGAPVISRSLSFPMYREIATAARDTALVAVFAEGSFRLGPTRAAPRVRGMYASANYFQVLGARTVLGRTYSAAEDRLGQGAPVAVISHSFWTTHLAGDPAALGRPIAIGPDEYTVIGILDPSFTGIDLQPASVWLPMGTRSGSPQVGERWWETNASFGFRAIARIEAGANVGAFEQRASRQVRAMMQQAARPDSIVDVHTGSLIEARGPGRRGQQVEIALRLGGVAFIVLIIAYANATNLLLARAVRRRREIAVRLALGISRWRLVRLLTLETMLIAMIAAVVAMLAGWWGGALLRSLLMSGLELPSTGLHWRVMLFTGAVALLAGVAAGVVPALQASNPRLTTALKAGARDGMQHRSRLRRGLVIAQAALSVVLLVGAGLFVRSLHNVQGLDIGYDPSRLLFGNVVFDEGGAPPASVVDAALRELAGRLEAHPGVEAVARTNFMPMGGMSMLRWYAGSDSTGAFGPRDPTITYVSPSFFQTTGIAVLHGSGFSGTDTGEPAAEVVVNEAAARLLWAGRDPIGACVHFTARENPCHVVVGMVQDVPKRELLESERGAQFYLPLGSPPSRGLTPGVTGGTIVVRARADAALAAAAALASALRQAFSSGYPIVTPMSERLEPEYRPWQLGATLFTSFGLLALLVAVVGIYSTVSYGVSQRTHEFGVRIALGARIRDVLRQVLGEGLRTVAIGIAFGVVLALAAGRMIASLLYGVEPSDPAVLLLVTASLLLVAMLAALLPAWRAARVDPVTALREE